MPLRSGSTPCNMGVLDGSRTMNPASQLNLQPLPVAHVLSLLGPTNAVHLKFALWGLSRQ